MPSGECPKTAKSAGSPFSGRVARTIEELHRFPIRRDAGREGATVIQRAAKGSQLRAWTPRDPEPRPKGCFQASGVALLRSGVRAVCLGKIMSTIQFQTFQTWSRNELHRPAINAFIEDNLQDLSHRLKRGAYRAKPVRRAYIDKSDGRKRPLGVPVLEDKLVQRATVEGLNAIYETDFLGFSYGFRPGRSQHNALDALYTGLLTKNVNWVLDVDIRSFFDGLSHEWLVKFVEHRVADRRVVRLIQKWLNAGVLEDGRRTRAEEGTPQGGSASPLLANVYLHYVFDLWAQAWRRKPACGDMIIVRFADDIVVGFQAKADAVRFWAELVERMRKFSLELHPEKTRLLEFGPFATENRKKRGEGKPETFNFLGFTHICGKKRGNGRFTVLRQTIRKRLQAKLSEVKAELKRRMHDPIPEVGQWLRSVVGGHIRYYGVPTNRAALYTFRFQVGWLWHRTLLRRSQKARVLWDRMRRLLDRWLPPTRTCHPYPLRRMGVIT